jgi:LVIVD repeat-containing protein
MRRTLAALAFTAALLPAGTSLAQVSDPSGLVKSDNVSLLGTIPNPGVIGARFQGDVMFVTSVTGLTTYDISNPASPAPLGALPLPHFENEDVDLGGDILLISNDAAESTGILYVVDISDPAHPTLLSATQMGGNPLFGGPGHTASCILDCSFAWVTDGGGIRVVDLRNPAAPVSKGTFPTPAGDDVATHDVQVDGNGLVWVVGFGGTAAYELPAGYDGNGLGRLVAKTGPEGKSTYFDELGLGTGENPNDFIHHNSFRRAGDDTVFITEEDYARPGCRGAGSFQSWSLDVDADGAPTGADLKPLDLWTTELLADAAQPAALCSAHYFDVRRNVVAQGWYEQGVRFLDVHDPSDIRQVGFFIPLTSATWAAYFAPTDPSGEIVYSLDASHGIDILRFDRPERGPLSSTGRPCDPGKSKKQCAEAGSPTLIAPIREQWILGTPTAGSPTDTFGFACRIGV